MTESAARLTAGDANPYAAPTTAQVSDYRLRGRRMQLADRAVRLGAFLINVVLLMLAAIPGSILASALQLEAHTLQEDSDWVTFLLVLFSGVIALWIVQAYLLVRDGQSIGKKMLGIKVVRQGDDGRAGFLRLVVVREFLFLVAWFIPLVSLVYPITDATFIFGPARRCLHDYLAGTKVVKFAPPLRRYRRRPAPPPAAPAAPSHASSDVASHG
jgi:uncharacterized RDD family membrane protein YckC